MTIEDAFEVIHDITHKYLDVDYEYLTSYQKREVIELLDNFEEFVEFAKTWKDKKD